MHSISVLLSLISFGFVFSDALFVCRASNYLRDNSALMIGFDPVRRFVAELSERFGSFASFFFDEFGGDQIGVVLKRAKTAKVNSLFSLSVLNC